MKLTSRLTRGFRGGEGGGGEGVTKSFIICVPHKILVQLSSRDGHEGNIACL
jgi:hypothetical protein